jgi:hypothetical protein
MSFDTDTLCMIAPLDPNEWERHNDLVDEDVQSYVIENIYKIRRHIEDYVNPIADVKLSWRNVK